MENKICIAVSVVLYVAIMIFATLYANADEYDDFEEIEVQYETETTDESGCLDIEQNAQQEVSGDQENDCMCESETLDDTYEEIETQDVQDTELCIEYSTDSNAAMYGETEQVSEANRVAYIGTTINIEPEEYLDDYCDLELCITLSKFGEGIVETFSSTTDSTYEIRHLTPGKYYVAVDVYEPDTLRLESIRMSDDGIIDLESEPAGYVEITADYSKIIRETEQLISEPDYINIIHKEQIGEDTQEAQIDMEYKNSSNNEKRIPMFVQLLIDLIKRLM